MGQKAAALGIPCFSQSGKGPGSCEAGEEKRGRGGPEGGGGVRAWEVIAEAIDRLFHNGDGLEYSTTGTNRPRGGGAGGAEGSTGEALL